jgi:hypothetical protein
MSAGSEGKKRVGLRGVIPILTTGRETPREVFSLIHTGVEGIVRLHDGQVKLIESFKK